MGPPKVLYFFDPLCVTCYSFRPVVSRLIEKYESEYYFDILSGGMVTGNRVGPLSQKSDYLLKKIKAIENTTGIQFGAAYRELLKEGAVISNSEPPSIAFNVFKSFRPDLRFQLAHSIQNLHFQMGKDLNQMKCYFDVCEQFGINKFGFMDRYQDPAYQQLTVSIFEQVKEWGIQHFPVLMLEKSEGRVRIQEGYSTFEDLDRSFSGVLGK